MAAYDEKTFFDLLQTFRSEETRRARRSLSFVAFTVIAAKILGLGLEDIKPMGLAFEKEHVVPAIALALLVLIYWASMFRISHLHDREMQKERSILLNAKVQDLEAREANIKQRKLANPKYDPLDESEVNTFLHAYRSQLERTKRASLYARVLEQIEYWVPACMFGGAVVVLIMQLCAAL